MKRPVRRVALLSFPGVSCSRDFVRQVKDEGFTDAGVGFSLGIRQFAGQGYDLDQTSRLAEWLDEFGLGLVLFTGYQKYQEEFIQEHPERSMVCLGGSGETRDSDSVVTSSWLCPFHPDNKAEYLSLLAQALKLPPLTEIHLNDEAGLGFSNGGVGCYCDFCVSEYEREFGHPPPRQPDWESKEWWDWIQHRMKMWTDVHAYFRAEIKRHRPDVAVGIQHSPVVVSYSQAPWVSGIDLARDAEAMDVMCTDPYHYIHYPIFTYRPMRRILTEACRSLAGATIKRSMNIYPQGFAPPLSALEMTRRDGFMSGAIPFALGAESITPYNYELMKIIPGFFDGLQEAAALRPYFEKTRPYGYVTVINPFQTEVFGYPDRRWGREVLARWPDVMNQVGLPWRWVFDRRLPDAVDHLSDVVILPDAHCLTRGQSAVLKAHAQAGKGLLWVGRTPDGDWPEQGASPPPSGETAAQTELSWVRSDHALLEGVELPVILESAFLEPGIEGETIAEVEGRPALVVKQTDGGREAWLAGMPSFNFVKPGSHGSVRSPTGGIGLLRNLLVWLAEEEPLARLWPYPPENAYGGLRPWDRRDVPTMELFPMLGEGRLVCLIFNYVGLAYRTNLVMRTPEGHLPRSLIDIYTGKELLPSATVEGQRVTLPVEMLPEAEFLAVELSWE